MEKTVINECPDKLYTSGPDGEEIELTVLFTEQLYVPEKVDIICFTDGAYDEQGTLCAYANRYVEYEDFFELFSLSETEFVSVAVLLADLQKRYRREDS